MGYIKKLKSNELVGGTDKHTIYPVTSTEAVFEEVIEDGESNFKSQKFLNNNITGDRINEGTITDYNIAVGTVTKEKLTPQVQTMLDEGQKKALTPKGNYNLETEYEALDLVFDPVTNSSYISLVTPNVGHPVDENAEGYEEGWWEKTLDGTAVNTAQAAIDAKVGQLETQVGTAITQAETAVDEAKQETLNAYTQAEALAQQITDWSSSEISSTPSYTDQHPLSNRASSAQVGYFECGTSSATQASNQIKAVTAGGYALPTSGGAVKIKMYAANTYTPTANNPVKLQFNADATTLKELRYNGEAVSPNNTWDAGEVISVFYDGTYYQASNAQGGSNRKIDAYLYGDLRTLAVGQTYNVDEAVKTTDKQLRRIIKDITPLSLSETLTSGSLKASGNVTYRAARTISTYNPNPSTPYSAGAYALGIMTVYTLTVTAESVTAGNITVNGTEVAIEAAYDAATVATKIGSALVIDGWTTSVAENVVTVRCNTIGNNTTTITIDVGDTGVVISGNSTPFVAGTDVIMKYDGESWAIATTSGMATDGVLVEVDEAWLIANATVQNTVVRDTSLDKELYSIPYLNVFSGYNSMLTASKTSSTISINVQRQDTSAKSIAGFIIPPYIVGKKIGLKFSFSKTSGDNTNTPLYFFGAASTYTRLGVICTLSGNNGFVDEIVDVPENTAYIGIISNGINRYSTLTLSDLVIYERDEQKTLAQKTEDNSDILNNLLGTNYFDLEKAIIYGSDATKGTIEKIDNGIKVTCVAYNNQILWWLFPNNLKMGTEYIISFDATIKGGSLNGAVAHNMDIYNNDGTFIANFIISKNGHYEKKLKINGSLYRFRINSAALIGRAGVSVEFTNISFKVPSVNIKKIEDIAEEVSVLDSRLVACESSCKDKDTHFFDVEEDGLYFVDKYLNIGGKFDSNGFHAININE